MRLKILPLALLSIAGWGGVGFVAAEPAIFKDADHALGTEMITAHKCNECHIRNVGGDGSDIYNPKGKINSPAFLRGMVDYCNTQLNLGMFPEEVTSVAAVLNKRYYLFAK
jgi:hypothetical protein